ncbi:MAG: helix-turn-helix transcriptional regulator [Candidatus Limnocylindrales bacterium]
MPGFVGDRGAKWDRAARYLRIATILHAHPEGISAKDIASQVGVAKRTVYRDLEAMNLDAELPIWQEGGRWGLEAGAFLPPLSLTLHEAMSLFLAARVLAKTSDELDSELIAAFLKLVEILPPVLSEHVRATIDAFVATAAPNERFTRVLRTLTEAWAGRRVVTIAYDAGVYDVAKGPRRARVRPYLIEPSALTHALYLIGWDEERAALRTFKVERIAEASLTLDTFDPDPGWDPVTALRDGWDVIADQPLVNVVVRFGEAVARRVAETRWHPSQKLQWQPDGSLIWRGRIAGTHEVRVWILGWGADAEVLEPPALRDEIAAEMRRSADAYAASS